MNSYNNNNNNIAFYPKRVEVGKKDTYNMHKFFECIKFLQRPKIYMNVIYLQKDLEMIMLNLGYLTK